MGKSEPNCRQIARRARESIAARRRRFESSLEQEESLTQRFLDACLVGDMERLLALLSEDVTLYSDGGGKTRGTQPDPRSREGRPLLAGMLGKVPLGSVVRQARVNGHPGLVGYFGDGSP